MWFETLKSPEDSVTKLSVWKLEKEKAKATGRIHAVRLTYRSAGRSINKKLFGYGPWKEAKAGKTYVHKPIRGIFSEAPIRRCGRACLVVPQELVNSVKEAIVRSGGEIKEVVPVVVPQKEVEEMADRYYSDHLRILSQLLRSAYEAEKEEDFKRAIERATRLIKKFEALIEEVSEYAEEKPEPRTLHHILDGLKAVSEEDFEAAKLQAEFLGKSVENEYSRFVKSSGK